MYEASHEGYGQPAVSKGRGSKQSKQLERPQGPSPPCPRCEPFTA